MNETAWILAHASIVSAAIPPDSANRTKGESLTAEAILMGMAEVYATCSSYSDTGLVKTTFFTEQGTNTDEKPFKTAYIRPSRFRFEFRDSMFASQQTDDSEMSLMIVWRNGPDVQTWWGIRPGVEKHTSLGMAIAGATGVSGGSAHTIPALLMDRSTIGGRTLLDMKDIERIDDALIGGTDCYRVHGLFGAGSTTVWIEKARLLVRRIDEQRTIRDFRTEETTMYEPCVHGEVTEEMLAFTPPE